MLVRHDQTNSPRVYYIDENNGEDSSITNCVMQVAALQDPPMSLIGAVLTRAYFK